MTHITRTACVAIRRWEMWTRELRISIAQLIVDQYFAINTFFYQFYLLNHKSIDCFDYYFILGTSSDPHQNHLSDHILEKIKMTIKCNKRRTMRRKQNCYSRDVPTDIVLLRSWEHLHFNPSAFIALIHHPAFAYYPWVQEYSNLVPSKVCQLLIDALNNFDVSGLYGAESLKEKSKNQL